MQILTSPSRRYARVIDELRHRAFLLYCVLQHENEYDEEEFELIMDAAFSCPIEVD